MRRADICKESIARRRHDVFRNPFHGLAVAPADLAAFHLPRCFGEVERGEGLAYRFESTLQLRIEEEEL